MTDSLDNIPLQALTESEFRYRGLVEAAPLAICIHQDQRLIYVNPAAARLVGAASPESITGSPVLDFVHPDYRDVLLQATREARALGVPTEPREAKLQALDGRILDVELVSIPFTYRELPATQVLVRDITEQKLAEERLRALVEAGDLLSASLDYATTLQGVTRLAALRLADWAAVDLLGAGGDIQRVAVAHKDPEKVQLAYELASRYPPRPEDPRSTILREGKPLWVMEVTDDLLVKAAEDEEHLHMLRSLGVHSAMVVPLQARGEAFGFITFANAESGRSFGEGDFRLAQELAARASLAIENARLFHDAQAQRQAAQASEERLQFILKAAGVGTWEWDIASGRVQWSRTLEALHNLEPQGFGGTFEAFQELVYPDDLGAILSRLRDALDQGAEYEVEYRTRQSGGRRWLASRGVVSRDDAGRPFRMVGICAEVTNRKNAEDALRAEQQRLATLVETSPIGVLIWHPPTDEVILANPEAGRLLMSKIRPGDRLSDIGKELIFKDADGAPMKQEEYPSVRVVRSGERVRAQHIKFEFPDGRVQPVLASAAPFFNEAGEVSAVALLMQDITAVMETERLRNEFLGMVTHELRSPLAVIKSATAMAKEELVSALESPELLDAIDDQANRMLKLVANLLDMAQIEAGAFAIDPHWDDLNHVLEAAAAEVRSTATTPIHLEVQEGLPPVRIDTHRINQVVNNLLLNAVRFADPGTSVRLAARQEEDGILVSVSNQGPAIPASEIPLLFRKFSRIDDGKARHLGSTGLGLSICRGIIEAHKGTIWVESSGASKETTFSFRLPHDPNEIPEPGKGDESREAGNTPAGLERNQYSVLVVDDEPIVLRYVQNLLRRTGYAVNGASSGLEAVQKVRQQQPDLVLLDLIMPELSGFEVLERIRQFSRVPVIFVSASNRDEDKVQGLNLGADDYISKPFSTTELAARIAAVLRRRQESGH